MNSYRLIIKHVILVINAINKGSLETTLAGREFHWSGSGKE